MMLFAVSIVTYGQQEVTKFLGIPVDGSKSEMVRQLKEKGFKDNPLVADVLEGEFNGEKVNVYVVTNNNKVWRIMVSDAYSRSAKDIKIRFNTLCRQFHNNPRYISSLSPFAALVSTMPIPYILPEEENIEYEIAVNNKNYEAVFYQLPVPINSLSKMEEVQSALLEKFTKEQLDNPTSDEQLNMTVTAIISISESLPKRAVWFTINELSNEYFISIFYDNEYNRSNGEDL